MSVESDPEVLGGKPVIKGTRIPIELVLELVQAGYSVEDIVKEYPHLSKDTLVDVLRFAKRVHESIKYEKVMALGA